MSALRAATGPGQRAGTRSPGLPCAPASSGSGPHDQRDFCLFEASTERLKLVVMGYRPGREMARPGRPTPVTCAPSRYRSE